MRRALVLVVALLLAGCGAQPAFQADPGGSTLRSTWADPQGDGTLQVAPGERLIDRTDLGRRRRPGRVLARIVHLTDAHVRDEESPARVAFLDRLGEPFTSTFRPQEALTAQGLGAAVRSADAARPDAVVEGGDLADNNQANEFAWGVQALHGGRVRPDSGRRGYQGPQSASDPDAFFYRPDVDAPRLPGLLNRAQAPFRSPGLHAPWYPVAGNHDVLVDGEVPRTAATAAVAVGDRRLVEPRPGLDVPRTEGLAPDAVDALLAHGLPGRTAPVVADPDRRELGAAGAIAALRSASHIGGQGPRLDYTFDVGRLVRGIVLDITRRDGGSGGIVTAHELAFLRNALAHAGDRWVIVFTHQPLATAGAVQPALALLANDPHVLAAVSGHTHANRIDPVRTPAGGYWSVTTASLADWPQQERVLQVRRTAGGGAVIETWTLDTAPDRLADTARSLAFVDAQGGRPAGFAGRREDRNVRLWRDPVSGSTRRPPRKRRLR